MSAEKRMKHTVDEHLKHIRAEVKGLTSVETAQEAVEMVVATARSQAAKEGKAVPTVVISQEHIAGIVQGDDRFVRKIIAIVAAVLDYEAAGSAPAGAGGAAIVRDGGDEGKEAGVKIIAAPGLTSDVGGGK